MSDTLCKIANDILYICDHPPVRGAMDEIIVLPRRLIDEFDVDNDNPIIVEDIVRKETAGGTEFLGKANKYVGNGNLLSPQLEMIEDDFSKGYMHQLEFHVYGTTPANKLELHRLANEPEGFVVILRQNYKDPDGKSEYLLLGKDAGCFVKEMQDEEGRNIMRVLVGNKDDFHEPLPVANIWDTSREVTQGIVDALLTVDKP